MNRDRSVREMVTSWSHFFFRNRIHTGSGGNSALYITPTKRPFSPGDKASETWRSQFTSINTGVKNSWSSTSTSTLYLRQELTNRRSLTYDMICYVTLRYVALDLFPIPQNFIWNLCQVTTIIVLRTNSTLLHITLLVTKKYLASEKFSVLERPKLI